MDVEINGESDTQNYILTVDLHGCPTFQICVPKNMDHFIDMDEPPYQYYLNFVTRDHYH